MQFPGLQNGIDVVHVLAYVTMQSIRIYNGILNVQPQDEGAAKTV